MIKTKKADVDLDSVMKIVLYLVFFAIAVGAGYFIYKIITKGA